MSCYTTFGKIDIHTEPAPVHYYRRRRKHRQRWAKPSHTLDPRNPVLDDIASADYLIDVFERLRRQGGRAPGPDRMTYGSVGRREAAQIMRELAQALSADKYRPYASRTVPVRKASGGHRILRLRNIWDRVVAAALNDLLTPVWEGEFLDRSMGFRPQRGTWGMLAAMEQTMLKEDRWTLVIDDIRQAFDNVNIDAVMADHQLHFTDSRLLALIDVVLRGGGTRNQGIDQGSAYSPTALNARLHHAHDLGMDRGHHPFWHRYADNLVYCCRDMPEGRQVLDHARQLLTAAGFTLKGENSGPIDLRQGDEVQLLGFSIHC